MLDSVKKRLRTVINFPTVVIMVGTLIAFLYLFSFLFPVTDNAFVVTNNTPISATVSGYVTDIHVKNGQFVKKGEPIITVFQEPYKLALKKAKANHQEAIQKVQVLQKETEKNSELLNAANKLLGRLQYEYGLKNKENVVDAIAILDVKKLSFDIEEQQNKVNALKKQIEVDDKLIKQQQQNIFALEAAFEEAKVNVEQTVIYALNDGYVQNLFVSLRSPIKPQQPLFSLIDANETYIQANFIETDLRNVKIGDEVIIIPRMYFGSKVYHGYVMSDYWAAERQTTNERSQIQYVQNENQWLLLPQRMPVQIKIKDLDSNYPLRMGMSAYVYIRTH